MEENVVHREYEDQDVLRGYIQVLLKNWWLIALAVFLAALATGVVSFLMSPTYETRAGVVIAKSKISVTFESQMQTLSESDLALLSGNYWRDQEARRATLTSLVNSGTIAAQVIEDLGDVLTEEEREPARLMRMVDGEIAQQSDLIEIVVQGDNPAKAAQIANAWATRFEEYVNEVYSGGLPASYASVQNEVTSKKAQYQAAQKTLTDFMVENDRTAELERLIEEKQLVISELQSGKQAAIAAVIEEEIALRRRIISAYLKSIAENRLLGFDKAQEAKRQVLTQLIDAEIANRMAALNRDRNIRLEMFNSYVDAELQSRLAVFDQQVQEKVNDLSQAYARKDKLERLLRDAQSLRAQVAQAGSFDSNQLALTLLKAEAFASSASLPGELQVQLLSAEGGFQLADVNALIEALEQEYSQVDTEIQALSAALLAGTGYQYLDDLSAANLSISMPHTTSLTISSSETISPAGSVSQSLTAYINQRYEELFDLGEMARSAEQIIGDTPLFEEFEKLYPELFEPDELMLLTESISATTPLRLQAQQRAQELLQLDGMETILDFGVESEPLTQKIAELQRDVREMRSEQESINSQLQELKRARDLAWETYETLGRKEAELELSIKTGGSVVTFAKPAIVPDRPISPKKMQNILMAGIVGAMLGGFLVLAMYYLNPEYEFKNLLRGRWGRGRRSRSSG